MGNSNSKDDGSTQERFKHTADGFKRDILPLLKKKGGVLVSARFKDHEYGGSVDLTTLNPSNRDMRVCLRGALATVGSTADLPLADLEAGFEGWAELEHDTQDGAAYRVGAEIARRFAANSPERETE